MAVRDFQSPLPGCSGCVDFFGDFISRPAITVPTDGPNRVYVPETAAQWASLGIPVPDSQWNMQGAGPNVPDLFGGIPLQPVAAALTYNVTVAGWSGKFITIPEAVNSGLQLASASYDPLLDSAACLCYAELLTSGGNRILERLGVANVAVAAGAKLVRTVAAGNTVVINNGALVNGVYVYEADTIVHPFLLRFRRGAPDLGSLNLFTDREQVIGPVDLVTANQNSKGYNGGATSTPGFRIRFGAWWYTDAKIALLGKATLAALRWPLFY